MKTLVTLSAAIIFLGSCTSMQQTASTNSDDVYASSKDKQVTQPVNENKSQPTTATAPEKKSTDPNQYTSQEERQPNSTAVEQDEKGNTYVTNKYYDSDFNSDDYYDYEYATRMRRFYHPVSNYGYYDNYYTNSYLYNGNPACWGLSVYLGYPWWGPSYYSYNYYPNYYYYSGWNCGGGWGYGGCGWGWNNGWGYNGGWCGNGWGYGSGYGWGYNNGYNNGYWDGYWNGYNDGSYNGMANNYYYNSYDNSGFYYGPRGNDVHTNGNAISSHGKNFENAIAMESGFTPVHYPTTVGGTQSAPRPMNGNSNNADSYINNSSLSSPVSGGTVGHGHTSGTSGNADAYTTNGLPTPTSGGTVGHNSGSSAGNPNLNSLPTPINGGTVGHGNIFTTNNPVNPISTPAFVSTSTG